MERKRSGGRRIVEPGDGSRRHAGGTAPGAKVKRASLTAIAVDRDTAAEAAFWQSHEVPASGKWEAPRFKREETDVLHVRLSRTALRRLKVRAAGAGLPLSTYASAVLLRQARSDPAR